MIPPWFYFILTPLSALKRLLSALWRWVTADPVRIVIALLIVVCAFLCWRLSSVDGDRDKWRDKAGEYEAAAKAVAEANVRASKAGVAVAAETKGQVEDGNERAREAAGGSDDPLRVGLDELRKANPPRSDPPAR